jgi:excisionase family DNA binding protein
MDKLMTFEEAAERLGTTPRHMRRLVIERRIAYRKLGRYVRFHPDDLAEYVAAHRVETGDYPRVGWWRSTGDPIGPSRGGHATGGRTAASTRAASPAS